MKTLLIIVISLFATTSIAQTTDYRGRKVIQNGVNYSVTCNKKSDNGGTLKESWSGQVVNGKREGVWKFLGTYTRYQWSGNVHYTGTVTMTRSYKNGIPHGTYSINQNITQEAGEYNYLTNTWRYGDKRSYPEKVTGSFFEGKPDGIWTCSSERNHETFTICFTKGIPTGVWKITIEQSKLECTFDNGHVISMKTINDGGVWGEELVYDTDPRTLPKDTVLMSNFIYMWDSYSTGLPMTSEYRKFYPEGSSNEKPVNTKYTLSQYEKHLRQFGNVPPHLKKDYHKAYIDKLKSRLSNMNQVQNELESVYLSDKNIAAFLKNVYDNDINDAKIGFIKRNMYSKLKNEYIKDSVITQPKYAKFFRECEENGIEYKTLRYLECYFDTVSFKTYVDECFAKTKSKVLNKGIPNSDTLDSLIWQKYGEHDWNKMESKLIADARELEKQRKIESFNPTEDDILAYICWKTNFVEAYRSSDKIKFRVVGKDASNITKIDIAKFILPITGKDGPHYEKHWTNEYNIGRYSLPEVMEAIRNTKKYQKLRSTMTL